MKILFWGFLIFLFSFFVHLIIWKIYIPKRQTKVLLIILFSGLIFSLSALCFLPNNWALKPNSFWEFLHIFIFVFSAILAYMITYSALETDSPSLVITMLISKAGAEGFPSEKLIKLTNDNILIIPRIKDLITDKMVFLENGRYKLTLKGTLMAKIFIFYRYILGLGKGG